MLWAAACLGYFGCLRAGGFTVPSDSNIDLTVCLTCADVAEDSHSEPNLIQVHFKQSKTGPFRNGVDIFLGGTSKDLCTVVTILDLPGSEG